LTVVDFTSDDARNYAEIRATLERVRRPTGLLDTLIAAQAVTRRLTLVSNNEREFRRVPGLKLANWAS
jgi:tRNA(fMet)-specific endonuclease VapC